MKSIFLYSLKVWLTAVFVAPLILLLVSSLLKYFEPAIIIIIAIFGSVLSIPSWLLLFLITDILSERINDEFRLKKVLTPIAIFLTFLPFMIFFELHEDFFSMVITIGVPYAIIIFIGIFFYRLNPKSPIEN